MISPASEIAVRFVFEVAAPLQRSMALAVSRCFYAKLPPTQLQLVVTVR